MIKCPKCNKELEDDARFCDGCGAQIYETIFCPNCGEKTSTEFSFCQKCGTALDAEPEKPGESVKTEEPAKAEEPADAGVQASQEKEKTASKIPGKALIFGGIGAVGALLVIAAVLLTSVLGGKGGDDHSLYLKDGEIVYTNYTEKGTMEITSRLISSGGVSKSDLAYAASGLGNYIAFSENGKRIFYPDRIDYSDDGATLYYRDINKPKKEPVKIDSDITSYVINDAGTQVIYIKGSDRILYLHDLTDKEKIASDVTFFNVSDDFKKIGYLNEDNSYYLWSQKNDKVKLAGDISSVEYVSDDISVIYYMKDGSLYRQEEGSDDKEKIASDVSYVVKIYDSGEVYYVKEEPTERTLIDYVEDDMAASDASLTEPERPEDTEEPAYPSWWDYDSDEEYEAALEAYNAAYDEYVEEANRIWEEYEAAMDAYEDKEERDRLREQLVNETMEGTKYTLCYFDGSEETAVTDALAGTQDVICAQDKAVAVFRAYNQSETPKVNLSEIGNTYEVRDMINVALYSSSERYIAAGAASSVIGQSSADIFRIAADGEEVYFLDDVSDEGYGDLYRMTVSKGEAGTPELYDSDVSSTAVWFASEDDLAYYKNVDLSDQKGDLFINGEEIDYDVRLYHISYMGDAVLYYTDWSAEKNYGTLMMSKKGKKSKIADDVHDYETAGDKDILYLYDYSNNYNTGTLYLYNNGKPKKLDDDVIALIPVYDREASGGYYYGW